MKLETFLRGIEAIYKENPEYKLGHDGSDGFCDCIGMIKGALRRGGETPKGLSGTNYAARYTLMNLTAITSEAQLNLGDMVLKANEPTDKGYDLPAKYKPGGSNYTGDLRDYYHIGTVTRVNPLEITHMTSPRAKKDYKLGYWAYAAREPQVESISPEPKPEPTPEPTPEPLYATVYAEKGKTVNMRKSPSLSSDVLERVPIGSWVEIVSEGEDGWDRIWYAGRTGYMMACYLLVGVEPDTSKQMPTIRLGDTGNYVMKCQEILIELGYLKKADGTFGKDTEKAIKEFQSALGLVPDGIVGPKTWAELLGPEQDEPVPTDDRYTVTIPSLTLEQANALIAEYPGADKKKE